MALEKTAQKRACTRSRGHKHWRYVGATGRPALNLAIGRRILLQNTPGDRRACKAGAGQEGVLVPASLPSEPSPEAESRRVSYNVPVAAATVTAGSCPLLASCVRTRARQNILFPSPLSHE